MKFDWKNKKIKKKQTSLKNWKDKIGEELKNEDLLVKMVMENKKKK